MIQANANQSAMTSSEKLVTELMVHWQKAAISKGQSKNSSPKLIETHISWIILLADEAYKIKKPVNFGFVDFSTLGKRLRYCKEEIRLNRRTAPGIYQDVVPVSGSPDSPIPEDDSSPIEYMVKMHRFPSESLMLDRVREQNVSPELINCLAHNIARFHLQIVPADTEPEPYGSAEQTWIPVQENFNQLRQSLNSTDLLNRVDAVERWSISAFSRLKPLISRRKKEGYVRECHGDLHLGNIFIENEKPVLFDCIEFNPELRWIDTVSDIAFTLMDMDRYERGYSHQLLNEYLELTGDYTGLALITFYKTYRAMVRAKVSALRSTQSAENQAVHLVECSEYLALAENYQIEPRPSLILFCGLSGTGKTTMAKQLVFQTGAIQIRSDVERKRLYNLAPLKSSKDAGLNIYTEEASRKTFHRLESLARTILAAGYTVIVDATFIKRSDRDSFAELGKKQDVPLIIVHLTGSDATIKSRLRERKGDASEAGFEQYLAQKKAFDPFSEDELPYVISIDTDSSDQIKKGLQKAALLIQQQTPN